MAVVVAEDDDDTIFDVAADNKNGGEGDEGANRVFVFGTMIV